MIGTPCWLAWKQSHFSWAGSSSRNQTLHVSHSFHVLVISSLNEWIVVVYDVDSVGIYESSLIYHIDLCGNNRLITWPFHINVSDVCNHVTKHRSHILHFELSYIFWLVDYPVIVYYHVTNTHIYKYMRGDPQQKNRFMPKKFEFDFPRHFGRSIYCDRNFWVHL